MIKSLRAAALVAGFLALLSLVAPPSEAGSHGVISVRVANGTADGPAPAGIEVVLHHFRGRDHQQDFQGRTDASGVSTFSGLDTGPEHTYQLTARYRDVPYEGQAVRFEQGEAVKEVSLTVYEPTAEDPGLSLDVSVLIVTEIDGRSRTIRIIELASLVNPGDRIYVPDPQGPAGPMALVRFSLPAEARDLGTGPGLDPDTVIQVDRGFAVTTPLRPGVTEIGFGYRVPYSGSRYDFQRTAPYPVKSARLLLPEGGSLEMGAGLFPRDDVILGDKRYRVWESQGLQARGQIEFALGGLPGRFFWGDLSLPVPEPVVGAVGGLSAAILAAGYAVRRRAARRPETPVSPLSPEAAPALDELVALDEAFAAGRLASEEYQRRRTAEKERLVSRVMERL